MGGKAFASAAAAGHPTIRTPRMTPEQYGRLRDILAERLQRYFPCAHVGTMIEAPEKGSYGDLDFIIASEDAVDWDVLAHQLGATALLPEGRGLTIAVRLDGQFEERPDAKPVRYHSSTAPSSEFSAEEYAQVDLSVIDPVKFHWWQFYSSYSDLAGILGYIVRKYGFTVSDQGLLLRYELLDDAKRVKHLQASDKQGMLFLSNDPEQVMLFLGLDPVRWQRGFTKLQDLFEWMAECRLLTREVLESGKDNEWSQAKKRAKERKRTIFPDFLFRYCEEEVQLPRLAACDETEPELWLKERRPYLQDEAVRFFNLRDEFTRHFALFHKHLVAQQADHILKPLLALHSEKSGKKLSEVLRAFRRWFVMGDDGVPHISQLRLADDESQIHKLLRPDLEDLDEDEEEKTITVFIRTNWEAIKQLERHAS